MNRAFLALGSNIKPERHIPAAVELLAAQTGLLAVSSVWETMPLGIATQPNFLNAAALVETPLDAATLKWTILRAIETELHRDRSGHRDGPRTIDIDLVLFNQEIFMQDGLHIPDPDVLTRAFVAIPLAELDPQYRHPQTEQTLAQIAAGFQINPKEMFQRDDIILSFAHNMVK